MLQQRLFLIEVSPALPLPYAALHWAREDRMEALESAVCEQQHHGPDRHTPRARVLAAIAVDSRRWRGWADPGLLAGIETTTVLVPVIATHLFGDFQLLGTYGLKRTSDMQVGCRFRLSQHWGRSSGSVV